MPTIIYPPSIPWNWMFQRPQQILRQLSSFGYTVIYEDLGHFSSSKVQHLSPSFILAQGKSPLAIPHARPRILWLTVPSHLRYIQEYQPDLIVYDAVDEPKEEFSSWAPYYPSILAHSDLIFTSGKSIYEDLIQRHPRVYLIPNGVDYVHFATRPLPRPKDLPVKNPIVGYSGAIAPWLDWNLLRYVTSSCSDLYFIFIGSLFQQGNFPLKSSNVKYLGLKPYDQLPAYFQHFSAGLIPFKLTEMTKGCNPIKLYEYYAGGLPVLATPLPELLAVPKIHLESDPKCFSLRLHEMIKYGLNDKAVRQAYARDNDWQERAAKMSFYIKETLVLKDTLTCNTSRQN